MNQTEVMAKAYARYIRISPRKVRLVLDLIRGEQVNRALTILTQTNKKATHCIEKVLKSALSNAKRSPQVKAGELFISKIIADQGPTLKRFRAAAMGRATMIRHRTSHLSVELSRNVVKQVKSKPKTTQKKKRVKK